MTIRDVARRAGVSTAAVSYVLNDRSSEVSEAIRSRVLEVVEELGYEPNLLARSLAGSPTRSLGVVWAEGDTAVGEEGLSAFLTGLGEATYASGYTLILAGGVEPGSLARRVRELLARQVNGLLLVGTTLSEDEQLAARLGQGECPVVFCGDVPEALPAARVDVDQREGMRLAVSHLLDLGHQHLAYLDAPGWWPYHLRREGLQQAMSAGLRPAVMCVQTDGGEAGGYQAAEQLLLGSNRPTAIACANDALAIGCMRAAWKLGLAIPEEVAVVGFGDCSAAAYTVPTLTTVRGSLRAVGAKAGRVLVEAAFSGGAVQGVHLVPPKLVVRESCGSHLWL